MNEKIYIQIYIIKRNKLLNFCNKYALIVIASAYIALPGPQSYGYRDDWPTRKTVTKG